MSQEAPLASPDSYWGEIAYDKYLQAHPNYRVKRGDVLIFLLGRFPVEYTAIPLCVFALGRNSELLLLGCYNPCTNQAQTGEISYSTSRYPTVGVFHLA